ncbi:biopolymer transporter ExbD [Niveibacterium umoris]|uniref:Biopolymer transport protein ExbD n=1 Tax=Niveibacterium umoris TaxID=1193620 RepID=A0A840BGG8_9RHOO|nr:biopolymer transporter ExbD [Niveibacterium umoris]MBB4010768.1 biopolymer transport protein ExbD [Niveibacterium umoris]
MGMNVGGGGKSGEPEVMVDVNTTPLIDVMLVLLIMLIITIPVQTHATKLNMPVNAPPPQTSEEPVIYRVDVDFDGTILLNGEVVPDRTALELKMKTIADMPVQPEVHLRPHKLVKYDKVAMVMATAQRLGVKKIGLVGAEQFM